MIILTIISEIIILTIIMPCYETVAMLTIQKIFTNLLFPETLQGISNTLQNSTFVPLSVDEIIWRSISAAPPPPPPLGIKRGSDIAWYKKGQEVNFSRLSLTHQNTLFTPFLTKFTLPPPPQILKSTKTV